MIDLLRSMAVFATVVELGSMNRAAAQMQMTPSAVSQHLRRLEAHHGVALLHRTTRKLTLTEAGSVLLQHAQAMVAAARQGQLQLAALRDAPSGELRVAAPTGLAGEILSSALAPLLAAHPQLTLKMLFHDEMIDLTQMQIDLALRASASLPSSSHVARRLADWDMVLCASPAYAGRRGLPQEPDELGRHDLITTATGSPAHTWCFTPAGDASRRVEHPPVPRVASNSMLSARAFALAGLGIAMQPEPEVRSALQSGQLVRVMPGWQLPRLPIHLVMPRRDAQPAKVRHAVEAIVLALGEGSAPVL